MGDVMRVGRDTCLSAGKPACGVGALLPKALLKNLGFIFFLFPSPSLRCPLPIPSVSSPGPFRAAELRTGWFDGQDWGFTFEPCFWGRQSGLPHGNHGAGPCSD